MSRKIGRGVVSCDVHVHVHALKASRFHLSMPGIEMGNWTEKKSISGIEACLDILNARDRGKLILDSGPKTEVILR